MLKGQTLRDEAKISCIYTLTTNYLKEKLRKHPIYNKIKK